MMAFFLCNSCPHFRKLGLIFLVLVSGLQLEFVSRSIAFTVAMETASLNSSFKTKVENPELEIGIFESDSVPEEFHKIENDEPFIHKTKIQELLIYCRAAYPIEWRFSSQQFQKPAEYTFVAVRNESSPTNFLTKLLQAYTDRRRRHSPGETERVETVNGGEENSPRVFDPSEMYYYLAVIIYPADGLYGHIGSCQRIPEQYANSNSKLMDSTAADGPKNFVWASGLNLFTPAKVEESGSRLSTGLGRQFKIINRRKINDTGFLIPCLLTSNADLTGLKISLFEIVNKGKSNENFTVIQSEYDQRAGFYLWGRDKLEGTFQCQAEGAARNSAGTKVTFEFIQTTGQYRNQQEDWIEIYHGLNAPDFERKTNEDATARIKINPERDQVECTSSYTNKSNADSPSFRRIGCETRVECAVRQNCFSKLCNTLTVQEASCSGGNGNCLGFGGINKPQLWKCTFGGNQVSTFSFTGLDNQQYYFDDKDDLPHSALIQLNYVEDNKNRKNLNKSVLRTNMRHKFNCSASKFLFTPELILLGQLSDGTRVRFPGESVYTRSDFLSDKLEIRVEVNLTSDMIGVVCLAPWSNSSGWFAETRTLVIRDVIPKIRELNGAKSTFHVEDDGKNLSCSTMADPTPTFKWLYENNTEIGGNSGFSTTLVDDGMILHFPSITEDHQGIYICNASNKFGKDRKEFRVIVKPKVETQTESTTDKVVETTENDKNSTCCTTKPPTSTSTLNPTDFTSTENGMPDVLKRNASSDSAVLYKDFRAKSYCLLPLCFYYLSSIVLQ